MSSNPVYHRNMYGRTWANKSPPLEVTNNSATFWLVMISWVTTLETSIAFPALPRRKVEKLKGTVNECEQWMTLIPPKRAVKLCIQRRPSSALIRTFNRSSFTNTQMLLTSLPNRVNSYLAILTGNTALVGFAFPLPLPRGVMFRTNSSTVTFPGPSERLYILDQESFHTYSSVFQSVLGARSTTFDTLVECKNWQIKKSLVYTGQAQRDWWHLPHTWPPLLVFLNTHVSL